MTLIFLWTRWNRILCCELYSWECIPHQIQIRLRDSFFSCNCLPVIVVAKLFAACLCKLMSTRDASPPKLLNGFGWHFAQERRFAPPLALRLAFWVAIAPGVYDVIENLLGVPVPDTDSGSLFHFIHPYGIGHLGDLLVFLIQSPPCRFLWNLTKWLTPIR